MTKISGRSARVAGRIVRDDFLLRLWCRLEVLLRSFDSGELHSPLSIRAQASRLSGVFGKYLRVGSANIVGFQILGRNRLTGLDLLPSQLRDYVAADRFRLDHFTVR
jgi:hypothetical protein